jgi:hypothetical protein
VQRGVRACVGVCKKGNEDWICTPGLLNKVPVNTLGQARAVAVADRDQKNISSRLL